MNKKKSDEHKAPVENTDAASASHSATRLQDAELQDVSAGVVIFQKNVATTGG